MRLDSRIITPEAATRLLEDSPPLRPVRAERVAGFASSMAAGEWVLNGIPILVSASRRLLDGRHRLLAGIEADRPFPSLIAWNVAEDLLRLGNRHRVQGFAQLLAARGIAQPQAVERVLHQLLALHEGNIGRRPVARPWTVLDRVLRHNPDIVSLAAAPMRPGLAELPESLRLLLRFIGGLADPAALDRLLAGLADPALSTAGARLRLALAEPRQDRSPHAREARQLAFAIQALNAEAAGKARPRLAWSPGRAFPRLAGYPPLAGADWVAEPASAALPCRISVRVVTPAMAAAMLGQTPMTGIVAAHVAALARDMRAGRWALDPQPLCFAADGRLLNGRHRLRAIIRARVAVELPVVEGLPDSAAGTFGPAALPRPATRALNGVGDAALVAAMANLLWQHEYAPPDARQRKAPPAELNAILAAHPRLPEMRSFARRMVDYGRPSVLGYAAYVIIREEPVQGAAFLRIFDGSEVEGAGQPVARLRRHLLALRRGDAPREAALQAVLETWRKLRGRLSPARAAAR